MSVAGSVAEIWRYPLKSMGGERLAQSAIAARGLHADRMWAVRDEELDAFTTALRLVRGTGPRTGCDLRRRDPRSALLIPTRQQGDLPADPDVLRTISSR
jgi:uncharacterized protein YcbX